MLVRTPFTEIKDSSGYSERHDEATCVMSCISRKLKAERSEVKWKQPNSAVCMATILAVHKNIDLDPYLKFAPDISRVSSTPRKHTTQDAQSEKNAVVVELLWREMQDGGWIRYPGLLNRFRTFDPPHFRGLDALYEELMSLQSEQEIYTVHVKIYNTITQGSHIEFVDTNRWHPKSSPEVVNQSELRPDALSLLKERARRFLESIVRKSTPTHLYWRDVIVLVEVKFGTAEGCWKEAREQLATYARQVFINQPHRRFVFGIALCHPSFEIWLFDRSGGIVTEQFNMKTDSANCRILTSVVYSLSKFSSEDLGYDTSITVPTLDVSAEKTDNSFVDSTIVFKGHTYNVKEEIWYRASLRSRGTRVWRVEDTSSGQICVIKDSWRDESRLPESHWFEKAGPCPHLPVVRCAGVVMHGCNDDTTEFIRGVRAFYDSFDVRIESIDNRVHERIVFETTGESIRSADLTASELLQVLGDSVKGMFTTLSAWKSEC